MKTMKKIVSAVLVVIMMVSLLSVSVFADTTIPSDTELFERLKEIVNSNSNELELHDVRKDDWYYLPVTFCVVKGMIDRQTNYTFCGSWDATRATLVQALYIADKDYPADYPYPEKKPDPKYVATFEDTKGHKYEEAINWATSVGVINGYSAEKFGPDDTITREQTATIIYRYLKYRGVDVTIPENFFFATDAEDISSWALEAITWMSSNGLMRGKGAGVMDPLGNVTRAEVATFAMRTYALYIHSANNPR